ncbi:HeH/LEM domain-containing protein [Sporanaerobacter sp. PP17-6a]|uniref:HeH/LEM domain-containing protein n=1 Tax=Sporanaerobacter sp. PP17-6a TaxID=1891289 RepID=UPI0008A045B4|nr:HeH/LEM domain-containing protein [Sporanaerobacter sp. PP17-6a]SCL85088.1 HeH/LEM domain protein [Sporanaerobacter sp. PP17-6a]
MSLYEERVKRLHEHVMKNQKKSEPTVTDLKKMLDEKGIEYDVKAKKGDLIKLLEGAE